MIGIILNLRRRVGLMQYETYYRPQVRAGKPDEKGEEGNENQSPFRGQGQGRTNAPLSICIGQNERRNPTQQALLTKIDPESAVGGSTVLPPHYHGRLSCEALDCGLQRHKTERGISLDKSASSPEKKRHDTKGMNDSCAKDG